MTAETMIPLNWQIMKNAGNWVTIFLMILFAMLASEVVLQYIKQNKSNM